MQRYLTAAKHFVTLLLLAGSSAAIVLSAVYLYLNPGLPSIDVLREAKLQIPLRVYSQNGELIGEFGEKFRTPIKMEDVPQDLINAILAAEDDRFLQHRGIDLAGLFRAALQLAKSGEIKTGGSTITMQVARNFFLSKERSFVRKFNEILLSLKIEKSFNKDEILELYVNKIYLGKRAYGIQAAAAIYYGKDVEELDLAQLAMIAGLPKAPSAYNPVNNPQRAVIRRNWILGRMHKLSYIDEQALQTALEAPVSASYHGPKLEFEARYAAEMARSFAVNQFGTSAYTEGLRIVTTIDIEHQRAARQAVVKGLDDYTARHGYRGPETTIALPVATVSEVTDPSESIDNTQLSAFKRTRISNGLTPALVTGFTTAQGQPESDESATDVLVANAKTNVELLLTNGETEVLSWNPEHDRVRPFVTENRRGRAISDIRELLTVGDIIRIRHDDNGNVSLVQMPQAAASLVSIDPYDGAITSLVGGYDFYQSRFNRATQAYRQPGSNFKPFIYAAAFANGYTAANRINDAPIVFADDKLETDWRPENASGKFYGPTTLRRALYLSRNLVSVRLLRQLGLGKAIDYLESFDFSAGPLPRDLSLALGSYAMTPLEVATLYATIANGGYKIQPYIVQSIYSRDNRLLYQANPLLACSDCLLPQPGEKQTLVDDTFIDEPFEEAESLSSLLEMSPPVVNGLPDQAEEATQNSLAAPALYAPRVMDERIAYILDDILKDVIKRGTGIKAKALGRTDIAGKTGTTNGPTDAWFSGYHPSLVATAWLGFDDNQLLGKNEFGGSAALPIWMDFMASALSGVPVATREQPQGLKAVKIDRLTGAEPTAATTEILFEIFREEFAPEPGRSRQTAGNRKMDLATGEALTEDLF